MEKMAGKRCGCRRINSRMDEWVKGGMDRGAVEVSRRDRRTGRIMGWMEEWTVRWRKDGTET